MRMTALIASCLLLGTVAGCQRDIGDQRTDTLDPAAAEQRRENMPPGMTAQLDSGSAAFRAKDFEGALRHYQAAVAIDDTFAAGWFGVYMAQKALGNEDAARDAFERATAAAPGATLLHPGSGSVPDSGGA